MSTSTCDQSGASPATTHERFNLPLPVWMVLLTLAIALFGGMDAPGVINAFNAGFGRALGEFALILIPSFTLAACVARQPLSSAGSIASAAAPFTGAGMVCPDTAYAALSPIAGRHKLSVAFGSSTGDPQFDPAIDADGDGSIGAVEFNLMRVAFGDAPGPSGLSCAGSPPCP